MKTTKDKIDEIRTELNSTIEERTIFFEQNTIEGQINLSYNSLMQMRELDTKIKKLQTTLGELLSQYNTEQRTIVGYIIFCTTIDSENKVKLVSKTIPYEYKELFMDAFDTMNSTELPKLDDVENWIHNNIS